MSYKLIAPAVTFVYYGLPASWQGLRWLERPCDEALAALWLGHVTRDGNSGILIGTLPRQYFDSWYRPTSVAVDSSTAAIVSGVDDMLNLLFPAPSVPRYPGISSAMRDFVYDKVRQHGQWPRVTWQIDKNTVSAKLFEFAGVWVATTEALPDAHIIAVGVGIEYDHLELESVIDDSLYGVDLSTESTFVDLRRNRRPEMVMPHPNHHRWHPDQLALIDHDNL
ncbi:MAG: hypothetical protein J2O49_01075 [Sciscionella sp.]|nr:hypothetical protein [Sciscionella sp.]